MAEPIGEIPVVISGDLSPLEKALQQAENVAKEWAGKFASGFNSALAAIEANANGFSEGLTEWIEHPLESASGALVGFVNELGPLGVAATAAAGAFALIGKEIGSMVLEEGAAAEKMSNFADQLNLSFNEARKLSDMAEVAGVNVGGLARVSMMLADALEDSEGRGKKVANALKDLGVTATDSGQALLEVLQKLSEIPDATERIAKAHEIMGRSAIALEPLIKDYANLKTTIEELGGTLSKEAVDKLKAADDAADKLALSWRNFKEELVGTFSTPVIAGLNLLSSMLNKSPDVRLAEGFLALFDGVNKVSQATLDAKKNSEDYNAELDKSNKFQLTAGRDMAKNAAEAFKRSEKYNKELDKSNEAGQKAAEVAQKHAAALAKEAEAYRVLQLSFNGVSEKLQAIKGIQFEKDLFPKSWLEEQKEILKNLDKLHAAMDIEQSSLRAKASIKAIADQYKGISDLADAFKSLGGDSSLKLSENLAQAVKNFNTLRSSAMASANDIAAAWNKVLQDQLTIGQEAEKTLRTRLSLEIQLAELTGASATAQIKALTDINLKTQSLIIGSTTIGNVYAQLNKDFLNVFDNLDKGLTNVITKGGNLGSMLKGVLQSLEQDVVGTFVHGITEGLKKAFIDSGVGQAISGFLTKVFGDVFGGLFKTATAAPQVAAQTANTSAITANTAAVTALTSAMGAQSAASAIPGGGGAAGGSGSITSMVNAISGAVSAISSVIQNFQLYAVNKSLDIIVNHTLGTVNQLVSLQGTFNTYLPEIADRTLGIWEAVNNVVEILRLMGQVTGGGSDGLGQQIADAINSNPHQTVDTAGASDGMAQLSERLQEGVTATNDYNAALQTTASTAYELDSAVSNTTSSLLALNDATKQVNGALPGFVDGMDRAVFNSMAGQQGKPGQNLSPGGARMNATPFIMPVPVPDALTGPGGLMQGAMLPQGVINNQFSTIAPNVGGPGVSRNAANVYVTAVDPTSRSITKGIVTGLEEVGIRVR